MNFWFSGPVYLEIGRIILFEDLCSIIWADHPEVLAITKIGVKNCIIGNLLMYEFRIGDKHWQSRNLGLDIFSFNLSFLIQCF